MSARTISLLRLASLPPTHTDRAKLLAEFRATGTPDVLAHKLHDFARRKFLTSEDLDTTQLTPLGRQALSRAEGA